MMYSDASITFYKDDDKICPDSTELLEGRIWSFVKLTKKYSQNYPYLKTSLLPIHSTYLKVDMPCIRRMVNTRVKISGQKIFHSKNL